MELSITEMLVEAIANDNNYLTSADVNDILQSGLPIVAENTSKGYKLFQPLEYRVPQPNEWFYNFKRNRGAQVQPNNPVTEPRLIVKPLHSIRTVWPGKNLGKRKFYDTWDRWANGNQYGAYNSDED